MTYRRNLVILSLLLHSTLHAENWPAWRGPTGQGHCQEEKVPLEWSDKKNVKWKVELANQGNSTPVIWDDRIFLTQGNKGGTLRSLLCLSRADGKVLWQNDLTIAEPERAYNPTWYCNASPAVDGQRIVVSFGSAGTYCYDLSGKELWKRTDLGKWEHTFGNAASPVLYGNLAILWCGPNQNGRNYVLAVNKETGKTEWEHDEKHGSWGTPVIVKVDAKDQLLLATGADKKDELEPKNNYLKGIDPKTGEELWLCRGLNSYVYTTPLYAKGVAVAMSGYGGSAMAVKLGGKGDITPSRLWRHPKNTQRVGSGVIVGDHVFIVEENGVPHCYELASGQEVWQVEKRQNAETWGSLVHAKDRLYALMRNGQTIVYKASPQYEVLAVNSLGRGQQTNSSLAISDGEIFIRTFSHLWCIAE